MPVALSVNLNAVAQLRNRRDLPWPSVVGMGRLALEAGAQGLTVHPRPDQRHIRFTDVPELRALLTERGDDPDLVSGFSPRWAPFDPAAIAAMREAYMDDIHWLTAGADGLATLTEDLGQRGAGQTLPRGPLTRGHGNDDEERRVAEPGRR